jgi:MoaA/NifB/PqqE/SkfB family radical SAM enzyme
MSIDPRCRPTTAAGPIFTALAVETVNACNRDCWFCKFGQPRRDEPVSFMPWSLIKKIVADLRALNFAGRVSWYKINEPLLDKRIYDILALTEREVPGAWQALLTNGDALNADVFGRLKNSGLDCLGVSVYDDAVMRKVRAFPFLKELVVFDRRPDREGRFVENRGGNIRLLNEETRQQDPAQFIGRDCARPSTMLNILPDGRAVLCCADFYGDVVLGNAAEQRLEDIWFGPGFAEVRRRLREHGRRGLALCETCTHSGDGHTREYPAPRPPSWLTRLLDGPARRLVALARKFVDV